MRVRALVRPAAALACLWLAVGCGRVGRTPTQSATGRPPAPAVSPASTGWRVVYRTSQKRVLLDGLTAVSATDAWAVGAAGYVNAKPIVLHWNGLSWRPVPAPGTPGFLPEDVKSAGPGVWVFGSRGRQLEAFRFAGRSWHALSLPAGNWANASDYVLGPASVWLVSGGCAASSGCSSTVAHWDGARWLVGHVSVLVSGLADVGGRVWIAGVAGTLLDSPALGRIEGTGRMVVFRKAGGGWQQVSAPAAPVSQASCADNPQLAAGADGSAWILCAAPSGQTQQGTLYHYAAGRWARIAVPARVGEHRLAVQPGLSYDGGSGVWLGPLAHWTGRRWVNVFRVGPGQQGSILLGEVAAIPDSGSAWAIGSSGGFISTRPSGPGVIAVNGALPH